MTYLHIVPPLALFLAKQPEVDNYDLSSVKVLLSGAAPLGGQITEQVEQRLGAHFLQGKNMGGFRGGKGGLDPEWRITSCYMLP